jgi:transposase
LAVSFPLLGRIRNFHPLATCAARRTTNKKVGQPTFFMLFYNIFVKNKFHIPLYKKGL